MGLDSVEIVMGWEEEFGLAIPDEVAQEIWTPRQAIDYIFRQVEQRSATECICQQTFFRLRRGFRRLLPTLAARFELQTRLDFLTTRGEWPRIWSVLRQEDPYNAWPEEAPFSWRFGFKERTVEDLVHELAIADPRSKGGPVVGWTREQVSLQVRRIVGYVVGRQSFTDDDEFARDLGVQ